MVSPLKQRLGFINDDSVAVGEASEDIDMRLEKSDCTSNSSSGGEEGEED